MPKLKAPLYAGFNAGKNFFSKMILIDDIVIDPEISKMFSINDKILNEIYQKILTVGYDESQPIVLQKGTLVLLDGHTRLAAAKKAGLKEIPAVEREFKDRDSAVFYTFERQALRRNLTGAEILIAAQMLQGRKKHDGTGRAAELLAKKLNIGVSTLYQAKAINDHGSDELKEQVRNGEISIKKAANSLPPKKAKDHHKKTFSFCPQDMPASFKFLNSAVILLVEANQSKAAKLLINHFLKKHERDSFYKILPYEIKSLLENEIATPA